MGSQVDKLDMLEREFQAVRTQYEGVFKDATSENKANLCMRMFEIGLIRLAIGKAAHPEFNHNLGHGKMDADKIKKIKQAWLKNVVAPSSWATL